MSKDLRFVQELEDLLDDDEDMLSMYLARKEMQKLAADQAAKANQAEQDRDESDEEGTSTEEEGGDLFPISPVQNKSKTPFSGQGAQRCYKPLAPICLTCCSRCIELTCKMISQKHKTLRSPIQWGPYYWTDNCRQGRVLHLDSCIPSKATQWLCCLCLPKFSHSVQ